MSTAVFPKSLPKDHKTGTMRALVFRGPNHIEVENVPRPRPGYGEAVIRVTLTTICGTDIHILKGEYPVKPGLIIGHEAVGVIDELGPGVSGYAVGERVLVGAITPCGQCSSCLNGNWAQCGGHPSEDGGSGTRFMGPRRNICLCPMRRRTWPAFPTI